MPSLSLLSSSLILLQALGPAVLGAAIPDDYPPDYSPPQPPPRACDATGCADPTYYLEDPTLIPDKPNVWIITFARPGNYQAAVKPDINKILGDYLSTSTPYFLDQLSVDQKSVPSMVKDGIPLLVNAITSITQVKDVADGAKALQKWGLAVEPQSPCGAFAAAAVPASLVAFDTVYFANDPTGVPLTNDLNYFLKPAYGSIVTDDGVTVHYNANFPDFFSASKPSTNVDRNVYVRLNESAATYRATPSSAGNPEFKKLVRILLQQFGQVKQWAAVDYLDTTFEIEYLKEYCKADYCFHDNAYEKTAASDATAVNQLLDDPVGAQFFEVWTKLALFGTLGLPTDRTYTLAAAVYSLNFDQGQLQIRKGGACSRTVIGGKTSAWAGYC